ncbi:FeoA family protein [Heliobacterium mobile]|nr:FeoA family protein [Heliobacterium mobile]
MNSLNQVTRGQRVFIQRIEGSSETKRQLEEMGLLPGTPVMVCQSSGGPMLVEVRGSKLMLGKALTEQIQVSRGLPREVE